MEILGNSDPGLGVSLVDGDSWARWVHYLRKIEFETVIRLIPLGRDSSVLEIGCGDGFQSDLLRQRFRHVFATDPYRCPDHLDGFLFAGAESLPFPDEIFDLVFSSNAFEHMADRTRAAREAARVMRPGGYLVHTVPTQFWKATSLLLNPVGYPLRVME